MTDDKNDTGGKTMKRNTLLLATILIAMTAASAWADGLPSWMLDNQLTVGFALGKGFVDKSDSEIAAFQYRVEFRKKLIYVAFRGSWVAQECNSRPNPKESSLLAGVSFPFGSDRNRINLGLGVAKTTAHGSTVVGLPCELRIKFGVLGLTAFSNFNKAYSFHGLCLSLDIPLRVFRAL
jgi:hypothetical protein